MRLNAADFGVTLVPQVVDAGLGLNTLWASVDDSEGPCTIYIAPGIYRMHTPVVWMGKKFILQADGVIIYWNTAPAGETCFTFGADPTNNDKIDSADNSCIFGMWLYPTVSGLGLTAFCVKNASNCLLERTTSYASIGIVDYCDGTTLCPDGNIRNYRNNGNIIRDPIGGVIKQIGTQASGLKIINYDGGNPSDENTCFDLSLGGGNNHVLMAACQTGLADFYIIKGTNNDILHLHYVEGVMPDGLTPYIPRILWSGNNNILISSYGSFTYYDGQMQMVVTKNTTGWRQLNPWHITGLVVEDLGSNNISVNPGMKQNYPSGEMSVTGITSNSVDVTYTASINSIPPYTYVWKQGDNFLYNRPGYPAPDYGPSGWPVIHTDTNATSPFTYTFTGLAAATTYWFWVKITDAEGIAVYDQCVSATTTS
jgi:hypothetical protein